MNLKDIKKQYFENLDKYQEFQTELYQFVTTLYDNHKSTIDIAEIKQRPNGEVKNLDSICENFNRNDKYNDVKSIFDIKDIAGLRIICHCEDDLEHFSTLLSHQLKQEYNNVITDENGFNNSGKSRPSYRAIHINLSKTCVINDSTFSINAEIQLRTVMSDAWAVQDRKYIYGKDIEGEAHELTDSVSEIMKGCERLWNLVKKKSSSVGDIDVNEKLQKLKTKISENISINEAKNVITDKEWFNENKNKALQSLAELNIRTYMEVSVSLVNFNAHKSQNELMEAARTSTIDTVGWPIGLFSDREEFRPKPNLKGIEAEIKIQEKDSFSHRKVPTYDFWAIHKNMSFYTLKSLFEDERVQGKIF